MWNTSARAEDVENKLYYVTEWQQQLTAPDELKQKLLESAPCIATLRQRKDPFANKFFVASTTSKTISICVQVQVTVPEPVSNTAKLMLTTQPKRTDKSLYRTLSIACMLNIMTFTDVILCKVSHCCMRTLIDIVQWLYTDSTQSVI